MGRGSGVELGSGWIAVAGNGVLGGGATCTQAANEKIAKTAKPTWWTLLIGQR